MAVVLLRGKLFNRAAAFAGLIGYSFLMIFEICSSFAPSTHNAILIVAMIGGLSNIAWYILIVVRFFQLSRTHGAAQR